MCERFRERFVCRRPNAILLESQRGIQQRAAPGQTLNGLIGLGNLGMHHLFDLPIKLFQRALCRFFECIPNARVHLFEERFRLLLQLTAPLAQHIIQLRLKSSECLLLSALKLRGVMFEQFARFSGARHN